MNIVFVNNDTDNIACIGDYPAHPLFIIHYAGKNIFNGVYYWSNNKMYVYDKSNTLYQYEKNLYRYVCSIPGIYCIEYEDISKKYNIEIINISHINELNIEIEKRVLEIICDNV